MRRIVIGLMSTISGLVLLFSYHTSTSSTLATGTTGGTAGGTGTTGGTSSGSGTTDGTSSGGTTSGADSGSAGPAGGSSSSGTYTGDSVQTRWGPVQVRITVENGKITKAEAVVYPQENPRDQEINSYAVPVYNDAAVQAQGANIDAISGATVTWQGYTQSLQSAIDQAHL